MLDLEPIKGRMEAIKEGPWEARLVGRSRSRQRRFEARFFPRLVQDVSALVIEVERLRAVLAAHERHTWP